MPDTIDPAPAATIANAPDSTVCTRSTCHPSPVTSNPSDGDCNLLTADIVDLVRQSDEKHLAIGRLLAESFYNNDRAAYESRAPKDISLRLLSLELRTNYDFPRSFSSLRQMLAAHFQEPDLRLTESDAHSLSWRARVELLRVHAPEEKAEWAHKVLAEKLTTRKLARRLSETYKPLHRPRTPRARMIRLARRMENVLSLWPDAPPEAAQTLRQLRDNISNARTCTRPSAYSLPLPTDSQPGAVAPQGSVGDLRQTTYDIRPTPATSSSLPTVNYIR